MTTRPFDRGTIKGSLRDAEVATTLTSDDLIPFANAPATSPKQQVITAGNLAVSLGTMLSIKSYGAKGDGVTDDAAAIQAALDAAALVGGGYVTAPPGTYRFGTTLFFASGVSFIGAGMDVTTLVFTPTTGNAIEINGVVNGVKHRIEGFALYPLTTNSGTGINCVQFKFCTMTWVRVSRFSVGVAVTDSYYSSFRSCTFDANTQDGVNLALDANALTFTNCSITDNVRAGVYVRGGRSILIEGGSLEVNGVGLYVTADTGYPTANVTAAGTYFEGNTTTDVWVVSLNGGTTRPKSTVIRDSYFQPLSVNSVDAIVVAAHDGVVIEGCTFDNLSGWSYAHSLTQSVLGTSPTHFRANVDKSVSKVATGAGFVLRDGTAISADRGDTSQTLVYGTNEPVQRWATALTANRTITLSTTDAVNGVVFRVVRTGLGAFTLDVGGLRTIPSATAAWVDVQYTGVAWVLTGYGTL